MQNIPQQHPQVNPIDSLISQAAERGYDPAIVRQCLLDGVSLRPLWKDAKGNTSFEANAFRRDLGHSCDVQLVYGPTEKAAGCLSCTRALERQRGYMPGSLSRLVSDCPAVGAVKIKLIIDRSPEYAAAFDAWQRQNWAGAEPVLVPVDDDAPGSLIVSEVEPSPRSLPLEEEISAKLRADNPHLGKKIDEALALYKSGITHFPKYKTSVTYANGGQPNRTCDCPDVQYRGFRFEAGHACKHTLCQHIAWLVKREQAAVVNRRIVDMIERDRRRIASTQAGYDFALRPDRFNRQKSTRRVHIEGIGHR